MCETRLLGIFSPEALEIIIGFPLTLTLTGITLFLTALLFSKFKL